MENILSNIKPSGWIARGNGISNKRLSITGYTTGFLFLRVVGLDQIHCLFSDARSSIPRLVHAYWCAVLTQDNINKYPSDFTIETESVRLLAPDQSILEDVQADGALDGTVQSKKLKEMKNPDHYVRKKSSLEPISTNFRPLIVKISTPGCIQGGSYRPVDYLFHEIMHQINDKHKNTNELETEFLNFTISNPFQQIISVTKA